MPKKFKIANPLILQANSSGLTLPSLLLKQWRDDTVLVPARWFHSTTKALEGSRPNLSDVQPLAGPKVITLIHQA